jgi:hypothetical protein
MTRQEADAAFNAAVERYQAKCSAELKYTTWDHSTVAERGMFADTIAEAIQAAVTEERERWIRLAPWWTGRALQSPEDIRRLAVAEERERSLAKVREIGGYYPTDVFREISCMETQAVHEHYPGIVDRISASMARFVVKRIVEEIEAEPPEDAP